MRLGGPERIAHGAEHELLPGQQARQELLAQLGVGQARGPQLGLHAHEARGDVALIEAARLGPFLREAARRPVHRRLARQQVLVGGVEHVDDELVLGAEVVVDERVVDARVLGDLAHAERGIALAGQAAERGAEDLGARVAARGVEQTRLAAGALPARGDGDRSMRLNAWFIRLIKL